MPKALPPSTPGALSPPANDSFPYSFFLDVDRHPFQPEDRRFNVRNAWWLADAAFLAYSSEPVIRDVYQRAFAGAGVQVFSGPLSTQCYVATTDRWIVVAIRGTQVDRFWEATRDWVVNLRVLPVPDEQGDFVHAGFAAALDEIWPALRAHILERQRPVRKPLWITGHSLGAAVGTIAASRGLREPALGVAGLYTYGSPRAGNPGFAKRVTVPAFRMRHNADLVAHVPFGPSFRHVGDAQYIDGSGELHSGLTTVSELALDVRIAAMRLTERLSARRLGFGLPRLLADHAPINYSILIWNAYEARG